MSFVPFLGVSQIADTVTNDTVLARSLLNEAIMLNDSGKYQLAYEKASMSCEIWIKLKNEKSLEVSEAKCEIGGALCRLKRIGEALPQLESALNTRAEILKIQDLTTARICNYTGACYFYLNDLNNSKTFFLRRLSILQNFSDAGRLLLPNAYFNLSSVLIIMGKYDDAIDTLQLSLNTQIAISDGPSQQLANIYNALGIAYYYKGEFSRAIDYYKKTLDLNEYFHGKVSNDAARVKMNIGIAYFQYGDYQVSIEYMNASLDILNKVPSPDQSLIAGCHNNLGNNFKVLGAFRLAIEDYEFALGIYLKLYGENHPRIADSYSNIGDAYRHMGYHIKSVEYQRKSLDIRFRTQGSDHPDVAGAYHNLAISYTFQQKHKESIEMNNKALEIRIKNFGYNHPYVATTLSSLGLSYFTIGNFNKSKQYLLDAIRIYQNIGMGEGGQVFPIFGLLGQIYYAETKFDSAIFYCNKLLFSKKANMKDAAANTILADIHFANNDLNIADSLYTLAEKTMSANENSSLTDYLNLLGKIVRFNNYAHKHRNNNGYIENVKYFINKGFEKTKLFLLADKNLENKGEYSQIPILYQEFALEALIEFIRNNKHISWAKNQAFYISEMARAYQLYMASRESEARQYPDIPDSLLSWESDLQIQLTYLEKAKQEMIYENNYSETDSAIVALSSKIFDLHQDYDSLVNYFEINFPAYFHLKYQLDVVPLQHVQDTMLQSSQTLLEYLIGDSSIFIFVIRPDTFHLLQIKKDFPLDDWVFQLRQSITENPQFRQPISNKNTLQYTELAKSLYERLIAPIGHLLTTELIIIPDGSLGYLPFEALLVESPARPDRFQDCHYFLQDHVISYVYSATLQREMFDKVHSTVPIRPLAAFAPYYTGDTTLLAQSYIYDGSMRKELRPLQNSGEEAYSICKVMGGDLFLSKDATEDQFAKIAGWYQILHLATHGQVNDQVSDYSFLAFTERKDSVENELLYVRELYNLQLNADLVVLSACETGIGMLQQGEGVISLARAFAYAGAKSIVTTLWSVDDAKTKDLMLGFYKNLKTGMAKNAALTQAKRDFLKRNFGSDAHPFYWAPFIGLGNMMPLKKP